MRIFLISDTHFEHDLIIKYANRPFKIKEHTKQLIKRWNQIVKDDDIVIHLGDFGFLKHKQLKSILKKLKGKKKILVLGNHDRLSLTQYYNAGFSFVCQSFKYKNILFIHEPVKDFSNCSFCCHGHIHDKNKEDLRYINVSVEQTNYYPVELYKTIQTRQALIEREKLKNVQK